MTTQTKKKLAGAIAALLGGSGLYALIAGLPEKWKAPALVILPFVGALAAAFLPSAKGEAAAEKEVADTDLRPGAESDVKPAVAPLLEQVTNKTPLDLPKVKK